MQQSSATGKGAMLVGRLGAGWRERVVAGLGLVASLLGLGTGLTIPFTMPTTPLMLVRIGAAELSLWLVLLNVAGGLLSLLALRLGRGRGGPVPRIALLCASVGAGLCAIPLLQLSSTLERAEAAMQTGLGADYASHIPAARAAAMRPSPFSLRDYIAGIDVGGSRVTRDVPYRTVNGHTLLLDRYDPPPGGGLHPGLLIIHGGSWRNGDKGEYTGASVYFANRGYVVYDIQYRLSAEAPFPAQLEDVEYALCYMRANAPAHRLDPDRVVTFGRSAGAHLALLAAYRANRPDEKLPEGCANPARVRAAGAYYAPTDLADDYLHPAEPDLINSHSVLGDFLGGAPQQAPQAYAAATPQRWLDRPVPPTLLVQGQSDQIVLPRNSDNLAEALRQKGNTVANISIPWAGHGFDALFSGYSSQLGLYYWERFMEYALAAGK